MEKLSDKIESASGVIGKTWPLYAFVTSNPLAGYENTHFEKAVLNAESLLGGRVFPKAAMFRDAWQQGEIDKETLMTLLAENGVTASPESCLRQFDNISTVNIENPNQDLDRMMVKWLMAFMDEGMAEWEMPNKSEGFYHAWKKLATFDNMGIKVGSGLPKSSKEALDIVLTNYAEAEQTAILEYHLAALPGWTGYIKYREETNSIWQQEFTITLEDYLAVRLWITKSLALEILPKKNDQQTQIAISKLQYIWLQAWESSWQNGLVKSLAEQVNILLIQNDQQDVPDAQLVFCIDSRSELIRRNMESVGNYETFGYAGFFGIAMDYEHLDDGLVRKSCPPIVPSAYQVSEIPQKDKADQFMQYHKRSERIKFTDYFFKRMKNMLPSAFGYVEGSGLFYGVSLLLRTLIPGKLYHQKRNNDHSFENSCDPQIGHIHKNASLSNNISLTEKTAIVKSAFDLMGWNKFSPLVLFVGHGSHSANNPFGSSLNCGACAASPGRHNARMFAQLANLPEVRNALKYHHDLDIPQDTVFIGAEHNTTTDEIVLFDAEIPNSHQAHLKLLKANLKKAQEAATKERLGKDKNNIAVAQQKANNWAETRPEWGLAKNAGFIVGPRSLTKSLNLNSHCFLHSYNWELDKSGKSLESIMQGPMVVTQWINSHYYFSTVDNEKFGGGSKITHNITGKFGVVQGNGGDLKMGLPLQSVNIADEKIYHRPLRLSVLIQAPKEKIQEILLKNEHLKSLLDNEWIYLLIMDPTKDNLIDRYQKDLKWVAATALEDFAESF
ncbi:MAG: DUF2309 domain-containing protein [Sphingobacteriaceae bacterium]